MEVVALTGDRGLDTWMERSAHETYPAETRIYKKGPTMSNRHSLLPSTHLGDAAVGSPSLTPVYNFVAPVRIPIESGGDHPPPKTLRERREAISQSNQKLKRTVSSNDTSMSRQNNVEPPQSALAGDKRRNKLGYHRTSVACGHCRRRKIRCIPEAGDLQGRCANCIRLKKECSFHPIDQPLTSDGRSKTSSRTSTGPQGDSVSSSPTPVSGVLASTTQMDSKYPELAMTTDQYMMPPRADGDLDVDNFATHQKGFAYRDSLTRNASADAAASDVTEPDIVARPFDFGSQPVVNWAAPDASPASTTRSLDFNMPWRSYPTHDSPMTPSFSPYTPNAPLPSANWSTPVSEPGQRGEEVTWGAYSAAHPRSVPYEGEGREPPKYSGISGKDRHFEGQHGDVPAAEEYAPVGAISMQDHAGIAMPLHNSLPHTAPTVPSNVYGAWNQQQQFQYARPGPGVAGWAYGGQSVHLAIQPDGHIPTTMGEQHQHQAGMYFQKR